MGALVAVGSGVSVGGGEVGEGDGVGVSVGGSRVGVAVGGLMAETTAHPGSKTRTDKINRVQIGNFIFRITDILQALL